jgi:hypothetical protein
VAVTETASGTSGTDVVLVDGTGFHQDCLAEGTDKIRAFMESLSEETISFRFFEVAGDRQVLSHELAPSSSSYVLLAILDTEVIGRAACYRSRTDTAEVSLVIFDAYLRRVMGTAMLERIAQAASEDGTSVFEAVISRTTPE